MKILITGGCGFIGSNFIIDHLKTNPENKILNLDKLTYAGNLENLKSIKDNSNYRFVNGDICDFSVLYELITTFKPDVIIHFAAESHVDRSIDSPMIFIKTNVVGTATLLKACQMYIKKYHNNFRFIHVSTDEVYGSLNDKGDFTENSPYSPNSPYSASKASSDHLVRAWHKTYDLPSIITNCSNNFGPYQLPEKLIPLIITNCVNEEPLPIYGDGSNIRDWLFVKDHCNAINKILLKGKIGETYNIGGNNEINNVDVVKNICSILDKVKPRNNGQSYKELITYVEDRPGHDFRYAINSTKIKKEIGWTPIETFKTGLKKTVQWYLKNEDWWKKLKISK